MFRKSKKFIAMALTVAMMMSLSTSVFAVEDESEPYCVSTTNYGEIVDPIELISLLIEQNKDTANLRSALDNQEPQVKQLLSEKVYSDGTVEKKFSMTSIVMTDEMGEEVNLLDADVYQNNVYEDGTVVDGLTVISRLYATAWSAGDIWGSIGYHIDKVTTDISKGSHGSLPTLCTIGYNMSGEMVWEDFPCSNVQRQTHTVIPTDTNFYRHLGPYINMLTQSTVQQTSGNVIVTRPVIPSEFNPNDWN